MLIKYGFMICVHSRVCNIDTCVLGVESVNSIQVVVVMSGFSNYFEKPSMFTNSDIWQGIEVAS